MGHRAAPQDDAAVDQVDTCSVQRQYFWQTTACTTPSDVMEHPDQLRGLRGIQIGADDHCTPIHMGSRIVPAALNQGGKSVCRLPT